MKRLITIIILLPHLPLLGQTVVKQDVYDLPIPKTLTECFPLLDKTLPDNEITLVKSLPEDSIYYNAAFKFRADFFHAWKLYQGSTLTRYFNKLGLKGSYPIYNTILVSYHRYLNGENVKLGEQIRKYQQIQRREAQQYKTQLAKDTINGFYIPKNLQECFTQLDKILSDSIKAEIKGLKDKKETIQFHHNIGMYVRNSWGLWGGSRLQKYFLDKKVDHPDHMSAIILEYYYDWLHNNNNSWEHFNQN